MRRPMTVVAVVHGYDDGEGARAEIYPYDIGEVAGGRALELMASWRPQPGELDDSEAVKARMTGLRGGSEPSRTIGERPRAAQGFVDTFRESDLALARQAAGSQGHSPVYDETYKYEIGEVMLFDAEVDPQTMLVDWSTARAHEPDVGLGLAASESVAQSAAQPDEVVSEQDSAERRSGISSALAMGVMPLVSAGTRVGGKAAELAREKGPAVMSAARTKLADPAVQAQLRTVASTAIEVGLASKGGRGAQVASKAATAMRVGDSVLAARRSTAAPAGAGRAVLSPTAAAVLGSAAARTVRPEGAQPGF